METFCQDRDLLAIEPLIFLGGRIPGQTPLSGSGGQIADTTFTCGGDLQAASVLAGMVLCTYAATGEQGSAWEILSVDSATTATVSILRADPQAGAVAPPALADTSYYVRTYAAQIANVSQTLSEKLRQLAEADGIAGASFVDSAQLRRVAAYGVLADIYVARAENAEAYDANWIKAEHYRKLHADLLPQVRLAIDADANGQAERTRSLGNMSLRRA